MVVVKVPECSILVIDCKAHLDFCILLGEVSFWGEGRNSSRGSPGSYYRLVGDLFLFEQKHCWCSGRLGFEIVNLTPATSLRENNANALGLRLNSLKNPCLGKD